MAQTPLVLAMQTVLHRGEICLFRDKKLLGKRTWSGATRHSESLSHQVLELLADLNLTVKDLTELACAIGPGSFTGIRVSVAFCKALGQSLSIPIRCLNSLELLAQRCPHKGPIFSVIDAQKNSVYLSTFLRDQNDKLQDGQISNQVVAIQDLYTLTTEANTYLCGDPLHNYRPHLPTKMFSNVTIDPRWEHIDLAEVYLDVKDSSPLVNWQHLHPLYVKKSAPEELLQNK